MKKIYFKIREYFTDIVEIFLENRILQVISLVLVIVTVFDFFELWIGSLIFLSLGTVFYVYAFFNSEGKVDDQFFTLVFFMLLVALHLGVFSKIYMYHGILNTDGVLVKEESEAFYFSVVTWTTLGYGDFRPSIPARPYAAMEALLGYLYMGIFIGKVIHLLSKTNKARNEMDGSVEPPIR